MSCHRKTVRQWTRGVVSASLTALVMMLAAAAYSQQSAPVQTSGQTLYEGLCASCHGPEGHGDGVVADDVLLRPRDFALNAFKFDTDADWETGTDADLANVIKYGPAAYGGSSRMPPWETLSGEDITSLVAYIRQLQQ